MCGLKQYSGRNAAAVLLQVRQANSDGREHNRYRNTILTRIDENRKVSGCNPNVTTYGWNNSAEALRAEAEGMLS